MPHFDTPRITLEVVRELEAREDMEALQALAAAATSGNQFARRLAVELIGRHPRGRELHTIVLDAFGDRSDHVVRTACDVVARWELAEAHDHVVALLTAPSSSTRRTAIRTLGKIWRDTDFTSVFAIYTGASDIALRREAAWVLHTHTSAAHWRRVFDAFHVDELPRHRQWACEMAESFADVDILPMLSPLVLDVDGHVRKAASLAIRKLSGCE